MLKYTLQLNMSFTFPTHLSIAEQTKSISSSPSPDSRVFRISALFLCPFRLCVRCLQIYLLQQDVSLSLSAL